MQISSSSMCKVVPREHYLWSFRLIDVLSLHFLHFLHLYTFYIFTLLNFSHFFLEFSMQGCPMGALFLELSSEPPCPYESFMWSSLNWIQRRQRKLKDNMVGLIFPLFGEKIDSGRRRLNSIPPLSSQMHLSQLVARNGKMKVRGSASRTHI